jgi:hypothetical protein
MGAGVPWAAVEAMADNAHGFDAKEKIIAVLPKKSDLELGQSS